MKWAFLISGIIELVGGFICYLYPWLIFTDINFLTDLFGLNAMVMGIINLLAYRFYVENQFFKYVYLAMMFMHGALAMICYRIDPLLFPQQLNGTITHLIIFSLFLFFYLKEIKSETA